jgi:hypothetical protein
MLVSLVLLTLAAALSAPPDTLVVCPAEFQPALGEWEVVRREQGHEITVIEPPATAEQLRAAIRDESKSGQLKYVVLIGDVPGRSTDRRLANARATIPTNYARAKVNVRWGSALHIASDIPYADLDEDGAPDLAIGRIPADSPAEVAAILGKSIRYEGQCDGGGWERRIHFASCQGGFGAVTDALVEAAARQVIQHHVPACYETQHIWPGSAGAGGRTTTSFAACAREQISAGSLAWVYMGHGRPTELDRVRTPTGSESILSIGDVPKLRCAGHSPLAVLVACSTGEMDAQRDCLAEELLKAEEGPVAVIAATRITMPYGNTVLGCEMLRACFRDRPEHVGDVLRLAGRRTLAPATDDYLRTSLDSLAAGLSPQPADLAGERREHVLMYHLYGDPLLHLRYAEAESASAGASAAADP